MRYVRSMTAHGTFEITTHAEPPYDVVDGVPLIRVRFVKRFAGPLEATSEVHMIAARTPVPDSAGYVAIERVTGTLDGRAGTFVLQHSGTMTRGARALSVTVVPDSATGALTGLSGRMDIEVVDGQHRYTFDFELPAAPAS
jgi:Protein of unknown function (DUF3224)